MAYGLPQQQAGKLDRKISLYQHSTSLNAMNEPETTWLHYATVSANVMHQSAREMWSAGSERASQATRFVIRFRDDISERDRIKYGSKFYAISGITEMGRREMLEISADYVEGRPE